MKLWMIVKRKRGRGHVELVLVVVRWAEVGRVVSEGRKEIAQAVGLPKRVMGWGVNIEMTTSVEVWGRGQWKSTEWGV